MDTETEEKLTYMARQIAAAMGLACREYRVLLGALARARMTQLDLSLPPRAAQGAAGSAGSRG